MDMNNFYQRFVDVSFDKNGVLKTFVPNFPENFNFGYDVVDAIAAEEPNRRAMIWCDSDGNERTFTYGEMKYYTDKTANMFLRHGIKKVMPSCWCCAATTNSGSALWPCTKSAP